MERCSLTRKARVLKEKNLKLEKLLADKRLREHADDERTLERHNEAFYRAAASDSEYLAFEVMASLRRFASHQIIDS